MGSLKVDILWSPNHDDKFVTFGTELSLYKVEEIKDGLATKPQGIPIGDDVHASLLSANSDNQYVKCVAWYPQLQPDHLLAVGLANGKVVLTSFGRGGTADPRNLIGKEFSNAFCAKVLNQCVPKHSRPCNHLAWNPVDSHLLAEGLDKYRAAHSILIWDVNIRSSDSQYTGQDRQHAAVPSETLVELGPNENVFSLAWLNKKPQTLVTGMNNKFLKIFDLRDISRPQSVAYTKAVYGVRVDPHNDHRLASYVEGQVAIWDTRNFDKPVLTIQESRPVMKLAWSPSRCDLLACLCKDSSVVKLYDIQNTTVGDELEPALTERIVHPYSQLAVSSFDWHPNHENRMLTVTPQGTIRDVKIFERIALNWSPDIYFTWACGRQLKQCHSVKLCQEASDDISIKMKRRASKGYGLQSEPSKNIQLVDNEQLKNLWGWLSYVKSLHQPPCPSPGKPRQPVRILGVQDVLKGDPIQNSSQGNSRPNIDILQSQEIDGHKLHMQKRVFRSEERSQALKLCHWTFDKDSPSSLLIDSLEANRDFARAAAVAVCTLKLGRAIETLSKGATLESSHGGDPGLNMVAMALSGFSEDKNALWRDKCRTLSSKLRNPYLRAIFAFLTADGDNYDSILLEDGMEVVDRVGFACIYLSDAKLTDYIQLLSMQLIEKGRLDGIVLTGLTTQGLDLLGRYVDLTGDVQTVALVMLQTFPNPELAKDPRVESWIDSYRGLLDAWRLWHQRAQFDVLRTSVDNTKRPPSQVFVSCNFCGKSVAFSNISTRNRHFMFAGASAHKSKITSCPSCRKPLPRCSLCLVNMGTAAGTYKHKQGSILDKDEEARLTNFSDWFTWCQTCRHGGHTDHITQWFREHSECPVTGCTCKCSSLDAMGTIASDQTPPSPQRNTTS